MTEKPEDSKYNYYFTKLKKCFKPLIGIGMCAMSSMIYTVANVLVKDLSHVDLFMITCIRYYVMVMLASPVVMKRIEIEHPFPVGKRRLLIWRGIIAASYMMINYYAIQVSSNIPYSKKVKKCIFLAFSKLCYYFSARLRKNSKFYGKQVILLTFPNHLKNIQSRR